MLAVIGIEHLGDVFALVLALHRFDIIAAVEIVKVKFVRRRRLPKAQVIDVIGLEAGDRDVPRHRHNVFRVHPAVFISAVLLLFRNDLAAKAHPVGDIRPVNFPGAALFQPVVRNFDLVALLDGLFENPEFIADAVSESGIFLRGERVHVARCQASQATVAEPHVRFQVLDLLQVIIHLFEHVITVFIEIEIDQRVAQKAADQKFHREIADLFDIAFAVFILRAQPALDQSVPQGKGQRVIDVPVLDSSGVLDQRIFQMAEEQRFQVVNAALRLVRKEYALIVVFLYVSFFHAFYPRFVTLSKSLSLNPLQFPAEYYTISQDLEFGQYLFTGQRIWGRRFFPDKKTCNVSSAGMTHCR